ncbi:MFS transporter [Microbispora hainanensis]|uniref:MFS transporter n=1 Tax=Microbispora hainanensis TaxID=568844 RepID=A0A544Z5A7_9ACTN|nr:MFS transporter [Microbispora hainanensis]TQS24168.1 MFS transporter [Microbispora hainanensis]
MLMTRIDTTASAGRRSGRLLVPVLGLGAMVVSMMQTLTVPILGVVQRDLHTTTTAASWLTTATLLSAAVCTPLLGRYGDQHGARRTLIGVLGLTLAGSALGATTHALPWLIAARALQGASTAIFPLAQSVIRDELPRDRLPGATALLSGTLAVGNAVALVGAGLLTRGAAPDFHPVFWLSAGVSALTLAAVAAVVPRPRVRPGGRTDWPGAIALAVMLTLLLLPLSQGVRWGWSSAPTLGCFAAAVAMAAVWARRERRAAEPLVDMRMLALRPVLLANLAGFLVGFAMFSQFLGVSALVQLPAPPDGYGFGATVLETSVVYLMPPAVVSLAAARVAGAMVRVIGAHATLAVGAACGAAGFTVLAAARGSAVVVITAAVLVGVAVSFGFATLPAVLAGAVPANGTGIANGINSVARSVGSSVASALAATLLTVQPAGHLATRAASLPAEGRFTACFALGGGAFVLVVLIALTGITSVRPRHDT